MKRIYSTLTPSQKSVDKQSRPGRFVPWSGSPEYHTPGEAIARLRQSQRDQLESAYGKRTRIDATQDIRRAARIIRAAFTAGATSIAVEAGEVSREFGGSPSLYLLIKRANGDSCKVRLSDHCQPSRFYGGYSPLFDKRYAPAQLSIVDRHGQADEVARFVMPYLKDWISAKKISFWYREDTRYNGDIWIPGVELAFIGSAKWDSIHHQQLTGHVRI